MVRNFLWTGTNKPGRARVAWATCCLKKKDGGLGMVDLAEANAALMCKWFLVACEPGMSNFNATLCLGGEGTTY
jgi:hypothetical protein